MTSLPHLFRLSLPALLAAALLAGAAAGDEIQVIYSEVTGDPTAIVPGAKDIDGNPVFTEFKAIEDLNLSPDGTQWLLRARNWLGDTLETMLLLGGGIDGSVFAQEGQPVQGGVPPEVYDFFDGVAGFNDDGNLAYGARARDGDTTTKEKVVVYDATGGTHTIVIQESDPALGLQDLPPNPTGDEVFGNSLNSIHLLNNGSVGFAAITINNIHSSRRPAVFYDNTSFLQSGVSPANGGTWDSFDSDGFRTTPDGMHWFARGDDEGIDTTTDDILVYDGTVVLREGDIIASSSIQIADVFHTKLIANGDWYSRGDDPANNDWAVRNGELIAATGDSVVPGSSESLADVFLTFTGNQGGHWILIANTDNADPAVDTVVVYDGQEVVIREGDQVDLDGNGILDDDAYIGRGDNTLTAFNANDAVLTDDGWLYFIAPLHNAAGEDLGTFGTGGDAFMRLRLPAPCSSGNVNADLGSLETPLLIDGSPGGKSRSVAISPSTPFTVSLDAPSAGPAQPRYVLWVWIGPGVNPTEINADGLNVGCTVNPTPIHQSLIPQPKYSLPGQGIPTKATRGTIVKPAPSFAPWSKLRANGLSHPAVLTLQALIEDDSTTHPKGFSVSNAVTLFVE